MTMPPRDPKAEHDLVVRMKRGEEEAFLSRSTSGETIYRLAAIRRAEPAADLFRVPADYEVKRGGADGNQRER